MTARSDVVLDRLMSTLSDELPDQVRVGERLSEMTTYRLGGPAAILVEARSVADLELISSALQGTGVDVLVVGRGSNVLVADEGFRGLVVRVGGLDQLTISDREVVAGGGVLLPVLARRAAAEGLGGLEFYVGIPGTVGGAVYMNAGGHGCATESVLEYADVVDLLNGGPARRISSESLGFGYRRSALGPFDVVVSAGFRVTRAESEDCERHISEIVRWRRENQPGGANGGSVFQNPPDRSAGELIDSCGLKGLRIGGAHVSTRHANFIMADPGATAADVRALAQEVRRKVEESTGIRLDLELRLVGFDHVEGK